MVTMESDADHTPTVSCGQRHTLLWWLCVFLITSVAIAAFSLSIRQLTLATNTPSNTGEARLVFVLVFRGHFFQKGVPLYLSTFLPFYSSTPKLLSIHIPQLLSIHQLLDSSTSLYLSTSLYF